MIEPRTAVIGRSDMPLTGLPSSMQPGSTTRLNRLTAGARLPDHLDKFECGKHVCAKPECRKARSSAEGIAESISCVISTRFAMRFFSARVAPSAIACRLAASRPSSSNSSEIRISVPYPATTESGAMNCQADAMLRRPRCADRASR